MEEGTYTLVIHLPEKRSIEVGALGRFDFEEGYYAYTGSAFGPGGLKRVDRHRRVASGDNQTRRWHVDYLNGCSDTRLRAVVKSSEDVECEVARSLSGRYETMDSFGSSDCGCAAHLVFSSSYETLIDDVRELHSDLSDEVSVESPRKE